MPKRSLRSSPTREQVLARLADEVRRLQAQRDQLEHDLAEIEEAAGSTRRGKERPPTPEEAAAAEARDREQIAVIQATAADVKQIEAIFQRNPVAMDTVRKAIDDRAREREVRGFLLAFGQNAFFLVAGWLLSVVAPPTIIFH
jgi:hypothetical protein